METFLKTRYILDNYKMILTDDSMSEDMKIGYLLAAGKIDYLFPSYLLNEEVIKELRIFLQDLKASVL